MALVEQVLDVDPVHAALQQSLFYQRQALRLIPLQPAHKAAMVEHRQRAPCLDRQQQPLARVLHAQTPEPGGHGS